MPPAANTSRSRHALLLVAVAAFGGCRPSSSVQETLTVFGGETTIEIRGLPAENARAAIAESSRQLKQLESEWHSWKPSDLTRINAAFAKGESAVAPASLLELIRRSKLLHKQSDGWYDPGVGGLVELWGFHTSDYPVQTPPPSREDVARWRTALASITDVSISGDRVISRNPAVALDFAAIGEGASAEQVVAILEKHGVRHALISMGGDVLALGNRDGQPWPVDMRDPFGGVLAGIDLHAGEGFFTSGNYNKFRRAPDGGRWGHILNPRTGMPAEGTAAVAVLHPDPILADAASTALFAAGPSQFRQLVVRMKLGCALLLTEENELMITAGMQARLRLQRNPVPLGEPVDLGMSCGG